MFNISSHFLFFLFFASFSNIFVCSFLERDKDERCLSMWVVMRERESVENVFFFFFFLPPSICSFFFFEKKRLKRGVYVGVVMGNNQSSVENFFFLVMTECVFIFTTCNVNAISTLIVANNIRKELIIVANYEYQITAKQSTKSIIINTKSEHKINLN